MQVFISWAIEHSRSHQTALLLRDWLPKVIQKVTCFVSSHDIAAGAQWGLELFSKLNHCNVGIICLTPECLNRPWLLFEAGALGKHVEKARVCPLLIDMPQGKSLEYPLATFQSKNVDKDGIWNLVQMVNESRGSDALPDDDLLDSFETRWPQFDAQYRALPNDPPASKAGANNPTDRQVMDEALTILRGIASGSVVVNLDAHLVGQMQKLLETADPARNTMTEIYMRKSMKEVLVEKERNRGRFIRDAIVTALVAEHPAIANHLREASAQFTHNVLNLLFDNGQEKLAEAFDEPNNMQLLLKAAKRVADVQRIEIEVLPF